MHRRSFIAQLALGTGATLALGRLKADEQPPARPPVRTTPVALPVSLATLIRREPDEIFGDMRRRAGVNILMPFAYTHEPHRAGLPAKGFRGGNFATPHPQYYRDTPLNAGDMRATDFGSVDVLERILPAAAQHGIGVFPFILEDNIRPASVPHWAGLYEVDHHGRRSDRHPGGPCYNNPGYQNFTLGLVEDYARSYAIGGLMWGSERQSGLLNALNLSQSPRQDPGRATCFCEYCLQKGRARGIDGERARRGFHAVEQFMLAGRAGERPPDGFFTAFWRILLQYPEALAWASLWVDSRHEFQAAIYQRIKSVNAGLRVGWHVWHNLSFSPFQRAEEDYAVLSRHADFLRPALYNNVAGERFLHFVEGARSGVLGDLSPEAAATLLETQLHYREAPFAALAAAGFSADYVEREVRRAVTGVAGTAVQIWPGVDIDVPSGPAGGHVTPASVGEAVKAAFHGGARGIILSRNYAEMRPENLSGAGAALRELGLI